MITKNKLNLKSIGLITTFENITRTSVIEFFNEDNQFVFIVKEGQASKAIGKSGANAKKLLRLLKKRVKIIEFAKNPKRFLLNIVDPIKPKSVEEEDSILIITAENTQDKAKLFGRDRKNLKFTNNLLEKYHKLTVKVA